MIYLYTEKRETDNWILKNDLYFNLYTSNELFTESDMEAIFRIDKAKVTGDGHIETKYGVGTMRNLSSGCKTYLNVIKNPDRIVSVNECGGNVLAMLFELEGARLFMDYPGRFKIVEDVKIMVNDRELVVGRQGYELWWSEEYRRRERDDL